MTLLSTRRTALLVGPQGIPGPQGPPGLSVLSAGGSLSLPLANLLPSGVIPGASLAVDSSGLGIWEGTGVRAANIGLISGGAALWLKQSSPNIFNVALFSDGTNLLVNCPGTGIVSFNIENTTPFAVGSVSGLTVGGATPINGGGAGVLGIAPATTNPNTNPTTGSQVIYSSAGGVGALSSRGSKGATTTLAAAGSSGTINSQQQIADEFWGTVETVSSAVSAQIATYTTVSGTGGFVSVTALSRATTTGTGIAVGDTSSSVYMFAFKNVGGTCTAASPLLASNSNQTTATALTEPVVSVTTAGAVITVKITNTNLCTIDSQVYASVTAV